MSHSQPASDPPQRNSKHAGSKTPDATPLLVDMDSVLANLNPAQLKAVKHDPAIPLQILAGPGSGKTKVLTSRIAQLILVHKIPSKSICAVTFTNKAANEMRERLTKLIGKASTSSLKLGTFHSICAKFLRMHCHSVGLEENFTICDTDESKKLINALLQPYKELILENNLTLSDGSILNLISKAKAKGKSAALFFSEMEAEEKDKQRLLKRTPQELVGPQQKSMDRIVAEIFIGYEQVLKNNNALDFDDLLIYGVRLFGGHSESVLWCKHILVDEFQDTNTMQYELMKCIGLRKCVTIVGDPDQSIYGWRSAEVVNLSRMRKDFPSTEQIFLEQNYRSTAAILRASLAIVAEDKKRIPKSLHTSHPLGSTPFLGQFQSEKDEASFIAFEIKRVVANMGGVIKWGDVVILLRYNALSRPIESALQIQGIPCRILGGHKFFERMEVKDILSYLQLVDNGDFNPAFVRSVKAPNRGVGDKSLAEIASHAEKLKLSQLALVEKIVDGRTPDTKPSVRKKVAGFVDVVRTLRKMDEQRNLPSEMIRKLVDMIDYEQFLKKTQQDWESRWENVQELITFATEVEKEMRKQAEDDMKLNAAFSLEAREFEAGEAPGGPMLRYFLQSSMLSSEGDNQTEEESNDKVTISTCHSAKGLEWPIVIVPAADEGTFPFYRTEDLDEERRLLYVACTRAQCLLYLLYSQSRTVGGKSQQKKLSPFVKVAKDKNQLLFSYDIPRFLPSDRSEICQVAGRTPPEDMDAEIERRLNELSKSGEQVLPTFQNPMGGMATMSLSGVRSNITTVPVVGTAADLYTAYAAPDALAAISASFGKDFRSRKPFTKGPTGLNPFFAAAQTATIATARYPPFMQPSSSNQPWEALPSGQPRTPSHAVSRGSARPPRPDENRRTPAPPNPPHEVHAGPSSLRVSQSRNQPREYLPMQGSSSTSTSRDYESHHGVSKPQPIDGVPGVAHVNIQSDECRQRTFGASTYHRNTSSGKASTSYGLDIDYPGVSPKSTASPLNAGSPCRPPLVSELPTKTVNCPRSVAENSCHATLTPPGAPQTAGVKRRLGMGRGTTGYSNKKFKPPAQ